MRTILLIALLLCETSIGAAIRSGGSTNASQIPGSVNGVAPAAGFLGEQLVSLQASAVNVPASSTNWGNTNCTVTLTPGVWDVTAVFDFTLNGATVSALSAAISAFSGATTTDQNGGDNQIDMTLSTNFDGVIPAWRNTRSSSTQLWLKLNATFSVATPQYKCRLSAVRVG